MRRMEPLAVHAAAHQSDGNPEGGEGGKERISHDVAGRDAIAEQERDRLQKLSKRSTHPDPRGEQETASGRYGGSSQRTG